MMEARLSLCRALRYMSSEPPSASDATASSATPAARTALLSEESLTGGGEGGAGGGSEGEVGAEGGGGDGSGNGGDGGGGGGGGWYGGEGGEDGDGGFAGVRVHVPALVTVGEATVAARWHVESRVSAAA